MKNNALAMVRNHPFWSYQIVGWSIWFGLLVAVTFAVDFQSLSYLFTRSVGFFYVAALGFALSTPLRYLFRFVSRFPVLVSSVVCLFFLTVAAVLLRILISSFGLEGIVGLDLSLIHI